MLSDKKVLELKDIFNRKKYCQIDNFFHPQLIEYFKISSSMLDLISKPDSGFVLNSLNTYAPTIGENLLIYLTPIYSKIIGKNLIPTYSYFRTYFKDNNLPIHKDRPSCQYSATIQINSSSNNIWPIMFKSNKKNIKINSTMGDIIFYKGQELLHWRERLDYEYSSHLFLHWVDGDDPNYNEYWWDGRERLGSPK